jgi:hypothetical protein
MAGRRARAVLALLALACVSRAAAAEEPPVPPDATIARLEALARAARPGLYPRFLRGEAVYWTAIGAPGDEREALLDEDGRLEVDAGAFAIEPFLRLGGALITAADARREPALADGWLPIPSLTWEWGDLSLRVRAFAAGDAGRSRLYASYRVENRGALPARGALLLAVRPLQVLPKWQTLNVKPALAPIHSLAFDGRTLRVDEARAVVALTPPHGFTAASESYGAFAALLGNVQAPARIAFADGAGLAAGLLRFALDLAPGQSREVHLRIGFQREAEDAAPASSAEADAEVAEGLAAVTDGWRAALARFEVSLPPAAAAHEAMLRASLAQILVHRDGPRLQPGSRNYARSWIRDGAFESSALLAFGFGDEVAEYLRWYAGHQFPDGKVPCCIDARGPDPTPEHDSDGEFLHAVASHFRMTRDRATAAVLWPHAVRAVEHLDALRRQRTTDEFRTPEKRPYYGLLPESISHEGYAKRAVHSYWDDLFALRGLRDAAFLAEALGDAERAAGFARLRDDFHRDLLASLEATIALHGIEHLPASVELGDFDPAATAAALATGLEPRDLPEAPLRATFARYADELAVHRRAGLDRDAWTPYEMRIADAFVRLGQRENAAALLALALADQRPPGWRAWPEILWRDRARGAFLGDTPHGWAAATFAHALRTMLVYERESDGALVVAAGVPAEWLADGGRIRAARLPTWWGPLDLELWREPDGAVRARLAGAAPPGGVVLAPPLPAPLRAAEADGKPIAFTETTATLPSLPADVALR